MNDEETVGDFADKPYELMKRVTLKDDPDPAAFPPMAYVGAKIHELEENVAELEELILWLAKTYQHEDPATGEIVSNDPVFGFSDLYGHELEQSKRLAATWRRVVKSPATRSE